jgi:hypothetical protein
MKLLLVRAAIAVAGAPLLLALAGCGQLTGLSDDYVFDLDGGGKADAVADGGTTDASSDASLDAANRCSAAATASAMAIMASSNGATKCKACLAGACCTQVEECSRASDCNRIFTCKVDCTQRPASERQQCFTGCNTQGNAGPPVLYTNGVGACSTASCKQDCGF